MDLLDIGKELKTEREHQGLSLENVHEDTRIGIDFLRSLEQGKIEHLSHPVYARGFVRSYAHYLGLDSDRIAEDFSSVFQTEDHFDKINPDDIPTSLRTSKQVLRPDSCPMILGIALLLMIVLGLGLFIYYSYKSSLNDNGQDVVSRDSAVGPQLPDMSLSRSPQPPEVFTADDENEESQEVEDTGLNGLTLEPGISLSRTLTESDTDDSFQAAAGERADEQAGPDPEIQTEAGEEIQHDPGKSTIEIQAREECWLRIAADQSRREVYLRPGESVSAEFEDFVQITLGNAGGVDIYLNGSLYPFDAASGQVKTIRISSSDIN
jgi:cytoskeleton protein RodZ